jgi:uncharacterized protein YqjF (DUF2071 family)
MSWPAGHRPYPLPEGPWLLALRWRDQLFAHWPVPPAAVAARVPAPLALDTWDGAAWLTVTAFRVSDARLRRSPPLPGMVPFQQVNTRTYVTVGGRPGVYFFSLDVGNPLVALAARIRFGLPYYRARGSLRCAGETFRCESRRGGHGPPAAFAARYRPTGPGFAPARGSLEYFLLERYSLLTAGDRGVCRGEIDHPAWRVQPAAATIEENTLLAAAGLELPAAPSLLHFAAEQQTLVWPIRRER